MGLILVDGFRVHRKVAMTRFFLKAWVVGVTAEAQRSRRDAEHGCGGGKPRMDGMNEIRILGDSDRQKLGRGTFAWV